jgi:hypothetical protein
VGSAIGGLVLGFVLATLGSWYQFHGCHVHDFQFVNYRYTARTRHEANSGAGTGASPDHM